MINGVTTLKLPESIGRLDELAHNLWWTWNPVARDLFRNLDYTIWRKTSHNPVKQLREIAPERLAQVAGDSAFLALYDATMSAFDSGMSSENTWFGQKYRNRLAGPVALFSAEFAIHTSLPIYAGGLGALAGDICKEASDIGLPLVGVGLMYIKGYFSQIIAADGSQQEVYPSINLEDVPIEPIISANGQPLVIDVPLDNTRIKVGAWKVKVGRVNIYLLDANIPCNSPDACALSSQLYTSDRDARLQQEIILGVGGVRILRALGIKPAVWHANEGHTSFMMLERIREETEKGTPYAEALDRIRANTVFTTHTPVPAGHDTFSTNVVHKYLHGYLESLGMTEQTLMEMGRCNGWDQSFNMTALGLRTAERRNAVSQTHGMVTRKMWHVLWPQVKEEDVPISHITNGVHLPTWLAPEMGRLYDKHLGVGWMARHDDTELWKKVHQLPDDELWSVRQLLKRKLLSALADRARQAISNDSLAINELLVAGALLDPQVFTIGFVRRFAEYKRPALIFRDLERLKRIINNPSKPVQIVFAGKSHPADTASKYLIQQVISLARDRGFQGRIAFVEDYNMHMAHFLVQGVDVWLNNPRRLEEACGTSGMKASINGVPHLSILDGWWTEAYNKANGWVIGNSHVSENGDGEKEDSDSLYQLLEEKIIPLYYERDINDIPEGWLRIVKEAVSSVVPVYCTRRMLKEYIGRMYLKTPVPAPALLPQ